MPALPAVIASYEQAAQQEFRQAHDDFRLLGEDNFRRYLPFTSVRIRVAVDDAPWEILTRVAAAKVSGCRAVVSWPSDLPISLSDFVQRLDDETDAWAGAIEFIEETDAELAESLTDGAIERLRYAAPERVPEVVRQAAAEALAYIADEPVTAAGRVELLWHHREQTISHVYHRYGNLGERSAEERDEPH